MPGQKTPDTNANFNERQTRDSPSAHSDVGFVTFEEMWASVIEPDATGSTKPAPSEIGRLAQLLRAAGLGPS